jgi:hypothetical protein
MLFQKTNISFQNIMFSQIIVGGDKPYVLAAGHADPLVIVAKMPNIRFVTYMLYP